MVNIMSRLLVISFLITTYIFLVISENEKCNITSEDRLECGWPGISTEACHSRNCCYDSTIKNSKWCFIPNGECMVGAEERMDCGWPGITQDECAHKNCCYNNSTANAKWCYQRGDACNTLTWFRRSCGPYDMTQKDCEEALNCCYDNSRQECYHRTIGGYFPA